MNLSEELENAHDYLMEKRGIVLHRLALLHTRTKFDKQTVEMAIKLIKEEVKWNLP